MIKSSATGRAGEKSYYSSSNGIRAGDFCIGSVVYRSFEGAIILQLSWAPSSVRYCSLPPTDDGVGTILYIREQAGKRKVIMSGHFPREGSASGKDLYALMLENSLLRLSALLLPGTVNSLPCCRIGNYFSGNRS